MASLHRAFRRCRWVELSLAALACLLASAAFAGTFETTTTPGAGNQSFYTRYPAYYNTYSCNTCHSTAPTLNATYGTAYLAALTALGGRNQANVNQALANIEEVDSDGDGYRNIIEINALRKVYDAADHPNAAVTLTTTAVPQAGAPAGTISYNVAVSNTGDLTDSFTLGVSVLSGQSWTTTVVGTANNLQALSGATGVTVNVAIPGGASGGQVSTARLTATSQANPSVAATPLDLTTSVVTSRYVNAGTGVDSAVCLIATSPCKTITYAMSQAFGGAPGDAIRVSPGIYSAALGEVFPIAIKSGVQVLAAGNDAIIDASGTNQRHFNSLGSNTFTVLEGFTLTGALLLNSPGSDAFGGSIFMNFSALKVRRNLFVGNEAQGLAGNVLSNSSGGKAFGGAIYSYNTSGDLPEVVNNVFRSNVAHGGAGGNNASGAGTTGGDAQGGAISGYYGVIANNTFIGNAAIGGAGGMGTTTNGLPGTGYAGATDAGSFPFNNIFADNIASTVSNTGNVGGTNNLFFRASGNYSGEGNTSPNAIFADPRFHLAPLNLRIAAGSPAAHAGKSLTGAPTVDFEGTPRIAPPSIGAYEATGAYLQMTDLNGNGRSDLLYRNSSTGQVWRFLMNGMALGNGSMVYTEANTAWKIVSDADFNGDGISDLLYRNDVTGQVYVILLNTSGLPYMDGIVYTEPNLAWKIVATPDLDGDGRADLLWWNSSTGQVYAVLMNGFAIKAQGMVYTEPNTAWKIVGVGDFSGSGKQNQLIWRNDATGQVFFMTVTYTGTGFTQTGQMIYQEPNLAWKIVGIADFNGNGLTDILWRNDATGQVYMMLMSGATIVTQGMVYTEPNTAWKIVAVGDYDGDGKADLLWRNDSTGQVYMMLMNGLTIASQALVYTEPNTAWKILGPWEYSQ